MRFNSVSTKAYQAAAEHPLGDINVAVSVDREAMGTVEKTGAKVGSNRPILGVAGVGPVPPRHRLGVIADPLDGTIIGAQDRHPRFQLGDHQLLAADRESARRPQPLLDQAQKVAIEVVDGDPVVAAIGHVEPWLVRPAAVDENAVRAVESAPALLAAQGQQ